MTFRSNQVILSLARARTDVLYMPLPLLAQLDLASLTDMITWPILARYNHPYPRVAATIIRE